MACAVQIDHLPCTEIIEASGLPAISGEDTVEFRLLYQGILRSNGNVEDKFAIRRQLHPQLRRLWAEHPLLREACERIGMMGAPFDQRFEVGIRNLADTRLNGFTFLPVAKQSFYLRCGLDVLFLRREKPGRIFMRGDIDNRLKTLFDALKMPGCGQEIGSEAPGSDEDPFYVLLQEDDLIADVSVTTDRLLEFPAEHEHTKDYAVLVINVKLKPTRRVPLWGSVFSGK